MNISEYMSSNFNTPQEKLAAARAAVYRTSYGRGNVIKVDWDDVEQRVVYTIPALGPGYKVNSFQEAIGKAASVGINEYLLFDPSNDFGIRYGDPFNQAREMYKTIYERLNSLSANDIRILEEAGIDSGRLNDFVMELITMQDRDDGGKIIGMLDRMASTSELKGAATITDDGARLINFKLGDTPLTGYQVRLIRNLVGQEELNRDTFGAILRNGIIGPIAGTDRATTKLIDKLAKVSKRVKGVLAARDIGLVGSMIDDFLGDRGTFGISINEPPMMLPSGPEHITNVIFTDQRVDILAKYAGLDFIDIEESSTVAYAKEAMRESVSDAREQYLSDILDPVRGIGPTDESDLKDAIKKFFDTADPTDPDYKFNRGKQLRDYLESNFAGSNSIRKNIIEEIFESTSYAFDGAALLNNHNMRANFRAKAQEKLDDIIANPSAFPDAEKNISELRSLIDLIDNNQLSQITGRGAIETLGNIKTAFTARDFPPALKDIALVIGTQDIKNEINLLGSNAIAFSGIGDVSKRTYLNPMQAAFHADIFLDDQSIENMINLSTQKLKEIEQAINANQLPESIIKHLEATMKQDLAHIPYEMRESALRNRQYAEALLDLHRRGASLRDSPQMMNMLYSFFQTEAFRYRGGEFQGVVPLTTNFAVATEGAFAEGSDRLLGRGYRNVDVAGVTQEILDFRVSGGQLAFSGQMTSQIRHALGGYDHDDKIQTTMKIFKDSKGNKKLGFYITRTPSGYQEAIFARSVLDAESVKYLFGHDEYFVKTLQEIVDAGGVRGIPITEAEQILNVIKARNARGVRRVASAGWNNDNIEQTIISIYDRMHGDGLYKPGEITGEALGRIQRYGSTGLRIDPKKVPLSDNVPFTSLRPSYKSSTGMGDNPLVAKIYTVSEPNQRKLLDLFDESLTSDPNIDPELKSILASVDDLESKLSILGSAMGGEDIYGLGPAAPDVLRRRTAHAGAILEQFYEKAMIKSAEGGDILGVYINRTMVAGSMLGEYERAYNRVSDAALQAYIRDNLDFGLLEYEEAIDLSTTFSGERSLDIDKISRETGVPRDRLERIYNRINLIGDDNLGFLGKSGKDTISQMGRAIGFMRAHGELGFGIDETFLDKANKRLSDPDAVELARRVIEGIDEYAGLGRTVNAETLALRDQLNEMLSSGKSQKEIKEFLSKNIVMEGDAARYAAYNRAARIVEAMHTTSKRTALSGMSVSEIVRQADTNDKSLNIARRIMQDHEEYFRTFDNLTTDVRRTLTETAKAEEYERMLNLGTSIYRQIGEAITIEGVSMQTLANAFELLNQGQIGRDIGSLRFLPADPSRGVGPEIQQLNEDYNFAKRLARYKYYEKFDSQAADMIVDRMGNWEEVTTDPLTGTSTRTSVSRTVTLDNLTQSAQEELARGRVGVDTLEEATLKMLANQSVETSDEIFLSEARKQADIVRSRVFRGTMDAATSARVARIEAAGSVTAAADGEDSLARLIAASAGGGPSRSLRTPYERFGADRLKNLFQNKLFRGGAIGITALVAGSLVYSKVRDITTDSVTGPPLLPGGNPYEEGVNNQANIPGSDYNLQNMPYNPGMSYKINLSGSNELIQKFNKEANVLFNGSFNTTIYDSLPRVDRDPYVEMGKVF